MGDFTFKTEKDVTSEKGKREYLNDAETKDFSLRLSEYFEKYVKFHG